MQAYANDDKIMGSKPHTGTIHSQVTMAPTSEQLTRALQAAGTADGGQDMSHRARTGALAVKCSGTLHMTGAEKAQGAAAAKQHCSTLREDGVKSQHAIRLHTTHEV